MKKVIEYETKVMDDFNDIFNDLLESLGNNNINDKYYLIDRIKNINDQIDDIKNTINNLLIDMHKNNDDISDKELNRRNDDIKSKKILTAFFPQMFLYSMFLNDN